MSNLNHGVVTFSQLLESGLRRQQIEQAVAAGRLLRIRHGWYAVPHAPPEIVRAVRAGGSLTCGSALRQHGVWVPPGEVLHVRMSDHHRRPLPPGLERCGSGRHAPALAVDPIPTAIRTAMSCLDDEGIVVVLDSVRNLRLLALPDLAGILSDQPDRIQRLLSLTVPNSQSGTETMVRFRLQRKRIRVRPQVVIPGVGRVDLLVGDRLVLELDSYEHHTGVENYARDRERDRRLVRLDYLVVRLTYAQVVHDWAAVWPDLLALIRTNRHRWSRRILFQEPA